MDLEQILKRLDWLDDERRKDKMIIESLEKRLMMCESNLPGMMQQLNELSGELVRLSAQFARFDTIESKIVQLRVDLTRSIEALDKARQERDREVEKVRFSDMESLNKSIQEVRKGLDPIPELKRALQARTEEDFRLGRLIEEVETKALENRRSDEEYRRSLKLLEEGQRQDNKRLTDIQGEVSALRKRQDEQRGRVDLVADSARKLEMRINELSATENERRQAQSAFFDKVNMAQVERERIWKEWQTRFEVIEKQAVGLDAQLQALDATQRAVKRSQEAFDEITQRFERRINEITEMQRLTEDRFRQEWVAYRADDQKRWTNYSLVQEEHQREIHRQFEKYAERLVQLEDVTQELQDLTHQVTAETQQRLQGLLGMAREWAETYDRTFGRKSA